MLVEVEHVRRLGPFFSLLLLLPLFATAQEKAAQEKDAHFLIPRIAPTAHRSAFIHGYLHGYEEGFHEADFDIHMGRLGATDAGREHGVSGYRNRFGPKRMFEAGYREGFRVGYADAAADRSFRAIENVESVVGPLDSTQPVESTLVDEGVKSGYVAGQQQGLADARGQHEANPAPKCPMSTGQTKQGFCTAYASGYGMGYQDGFVNQARTVVAQAK